MNKLDLYSCSYQAHIHCIYRVAEGLSEEDAGAEEDEAAAANLAPETEHRKVLNFVPHQAPNKVAESDRVLSEISDKPLNSSLRSVRHIMFFYFSYKFLHMLHFKYDFWNGSLAFHYSG